MVAFFDFSYVTYSLLFVAVVNTIPISVANRPLNIFASLLFLAVESYYGSLFIAIRIVLKIFGVYLPSFPMSLFPYLPLIRIPPLIIIRVIPWCMPLEKHNRYISIFRPLSIVPVEKPLLPVNSNTPTADHTAPQPSASLSATAATSSDLLSNA